MPPSSATHPGSQQALHRSHFHGTLLRAYLVVCLCAVVVPAGAQDASETDRIATDQAETDQARTARRRPNVIVVLSDDQGSIDLPALGSEDLHLPHLESLVRRGTLFSQFYAAAPVCSPSRAGLLTGRYPVRAGVPGNVSSQQGHAGMPSPQVTIAETFRAAGYATAHIGKWHLGYTPETMPNGQGFDFSFGHMGGCIDNWSHFFYWQGPNRHDLWRQGQEVYTDEGHYFPALMLREAKAFLAAHQDQPFLMYYALNTPHYPYQGHARWLDYYSHVPYPRNLYNAFLSTQDEYLGALFAELDRLEMRAETIVIFQSDHGHSTEERAHRGGGSAGPYRGAKFSLFEGGIRVPAVISWPGHLPAGRVVTGVAHSCDWLPTLAELCEVPLVEDDIDGLSLVGMLRGQPSPHQLRPLHWTIGNSWAVRQGPWKLIHNPRDTSQPGPGNTPDRLFLSNLDADVSEQTNMAEAHPEIVTRLEQLHRDWQRTLAE